MIIGINLKLEIKRRQGQALLVASLLCVGASEITSETLRMTTTYPAPSGVYQKLSVKESLYRPYLNTDPLDTATCNYGGIVGPCKGSATVPAPGRLFFNASQNAFYHTSADAVASDPESWYKPVSGVDSRPLASATMTRWDPTANSVSLRNIGRVTAGGTPWTPGIEPNVKLYPGTGYKVFVDKKITGMGLYSMSLEGEYCSLQTADTANPTIRLYRQAVGYDPTIVASSSDDILLNPLDDDGTETNPYIGAFRCVPFELSAVFTMGKGYKWSFYAAFQEDGGCNQVSGISVCRRDYLQGKSDGALPLKLEVTRLMAF